MGGRDDGDDESRGCGRCCSRSPTGCSAASATPRTSSRRPSCATTARSPTGAEIESPKAYLSAVTTRLAIDHLRSARVRAETYVGDWLPEPLLTDDDAARPGAPRRARPTRCRWRSSLLLEQPVPGRARGVPAARRLRLRLRRDRRHRRQDRGQLPPARGPRPAPRRRAASRASRRPGESASELAARFFAAVADGDMDGLVELLAPTSSCYGDGGGKSPSWPRPIVGRDRVRRLLLGLGRQLARARVSPMRPRRGQRPAGGDGPRRRTGG